MKYPDTIETPREGLLKRIWRISTTNRLWNNVSHGAIAAAIVFAFAWLGFSAQTAFVIAVWTYAFNEGRDVVEKWPKPDLVDGIPDLIFAAVGAVLAMLAVMVFG